MVAAGMWSKERLWAHRLYGYMSSKGPNLEQKAGDIMAVCLDPPAYAGVFLVEEKAAGRAPDGGGRVGPLSRGRGERQGFDYNGEDTLALLGGGEDEHRRSDRQDRGAAQVGAVHGVCYRHRG